MCVIFIGHLSFTELIKNDPSLGCIPVPILIPMLAMLTYTEG